MADQRNKIPPHFLVIVPGWMGSNLKIGDVMVWGDFFQTLKYSLGFKAPLDFLFQSMTYSDSSSELKPAGIVKEIIFVPPWIKQPQYNRLLSHLRSIGYSIDPADDVTATKAAYTFAYDWRQDNRTSARELGTAIERWRARHPGASVWIIAHSNGGLVARYYIEILGGKDIVNKLFLMGAPEDGTPLALQALTDGLAILIRKVFSRYESHERSRDMVRTFPSLYQLLPSSNPFLSTVDNVPLDVFDGDGWLPGQYHSLLKEGQRFNQELGTTLSVETFCFYGVQQTTFSAAQVSLLDETHWGKVTWTQHVVGDGVIPRWSAIHENANQILPYSVSHRNIYIARDVLEKLKFELIDRYLPAKRDVLSTPRHVITFMPDKDIYSPGEEIVAQLSIRTNDEAQAPVAKARIKVSLKWEQMLPGSAQTTPPPAIEIDIWESQKTAGLYEGKLLAPMIEGYYRLEATVQMKDVASVTLQELIAVEADT